MRVSVQRQKIRFASGGAECAAWHYPGRNGACVIMAGGFAVPKEPGTDRFARRFNEAGFDVLAFDFRGLGESGAGESSEGDCPVLSPRGQVADWQAALAFARTLPGVDPSRLALWGFSATGGQILHVAALEPEVAAVVAQTPGVGGSATSRNAARYQRHWAMARLIGRGVLDEVGSWVGRAPRPVPLGGRRGQVALLTTPEAELSPSPLDPDGAYPRWRQVVAARSAVRMALYAPGRYAAQVRCPLLVLVCDGDTSAPPELALKASQAAPHAVVVHLPGHHYAPFLDQHEPAVEAELAFLRGHLT